MTEIREALAVGKSANCHKAQVDSSQIHFTSTYPERLYMSRIRPPEEPPLSLPRPWERGKKSGRRRSILLWEEKEHNLVDLVRA